MEAATTKEARQRLPDTELIRLATAHELELVEDERAALIAEMAAKKAAEAEQAPSQEQPKRKRRRRG